MPEAGLTSHHPTSSLNEVTLYGIPNCDQVKKARSWLDQQKQTYHFHDFKKAGVAPELLDRWLKQRTWEELINRKGTTWRKLADHEQPTDLNSAIALMRAQPSIIKRPILASASTLEIGFNEARYAQIFG